jgi:hypothetical protein
MSDFIERYFGVAPDNGNGSIEFLLVMFLCIDSYDCVALARADPSHEVTEEHQRARLSSVPPSMPFAGAGIRWCVLLAGRYHRLPGERLAGGRF